MLIIGADKQKFEVLMRKLLNKFEINNLGAIDQIHRDQSKKLLSFTWEYIKCILRWFHVDGAKAVCTPLAAHFKLSTKQSLDLKDVLMKMKVPYVSTIGNMMYAMVCTWLVISLVVCFVSSFIKNPV